MLFLNLRSLKKIFSMVCKPVPKALYVGNSYYSFNLILKRADFSLKQMFYAFILYINMCSLRYCKKQFS